MISRAAGGKSYTLSAYVKTSNVSASGTASGATMHLAWYKGDTLLGQKAMSYGLKGTHDWSRISLTAEVPSGADHIGVYFDLTSATGTVWFDAMQLEEGASANAVNLLEDSDLKNPALWTTNRVREFKNGICRFTPSVSASSINCYMYQMVSVNAADVCFNVYGTASASSVPLRGERGFMLELAIEYADGQAEWHNRSFNEALSDWQQVSVNVRPKRKGVKVSRVGVWFVYRENANSASVDNLMLNMDMTGSTYDYDSQGNLISAADNAERNQSYTYSNANELTKVTDAKNESYLYNYSPSNEHQLQSVISSQQQIGYAFEHDSAGNVTGLTMSSNCNRLGVGQTGSITMYSRTEYDANKNYVTKETDTRGKSVSYTVNGNNGLVSKVTGPKPGSTSGETVATSYAYNTRNPYLLDSVTRGNVSNFYGYDTLNRLTSIYHNGFNYNFSYDEWGNRLKTMIGTQTLATNTYNANHGTLKKTTYGNGDWIQYDYDRYERVTKTTGETGAMAAYVYNNQGQTARVTDSLSGNTTEYTYDLLGRLVGSQSTGKNVVQGWYSYDNVNRFTGETVSTSGGDHAWSVEYGKDNQVTKSLQGLFSHKYSYDGLGRRSTDSLYGSESTKSLESLQYMYAAGANGHTSPLVSSMTWREQGAPVYAYKAKYEYTYDDAGNILTVKENGVLKATYTYDQFGQLTREDNVWANRSFVHIYDAGGNIMERLECRYTTGALSRSDVLFSAMYTYDSVWKDKVTEIGGVTIQYDEIGNPKNWPGVPNLAWGNGRRLTALRVGISSVSYTYDEAGLRTKKTVGSSETFYDRDASGKMVHEKRGSNHLYYYYDADGSIGSISYNGTRYAFRKNLQGDVIALLDTTGKVVAQYAYDAWGNILSVTDASSNAITSSTHIANINPIRYRGYYYDTETKWYYLNSRYYDPAVRRFINADSEISGNDNQITGKNLFVYCFNNPVMLTDEAGTWPKWVSGLINVVSGVCQAAAGAALIASAPVTGGVSAVAGSILLVNGAATVSQGIGQIVNDVVNSNVMREDNIVKTGVQSVGEMVGGDTGAEIAGTAYDAAVVAVSVAAPAIAVKTTLQQAGKVSIEVSISKVVNNPADEFVSIGPKAGQVVSKIYEIQTTGKYSVYATPLPNGYYQIANGHHTVQALRSMGTEKIKLFITK